MCCALTKSLCDGPEDSYFSVLNFFVEEGTTHRVLIKRRLK